MSEKEKENILEGLREIKEALRETRISIERLKESQKETDKKIKELTESQKKTDEQMKETDRKMRETDKRLKETDRRIKALTKAISELNGVWKNFSEKIVFDNIEDALKEVGFNVEYIIENVKKRIGSESIEIDILAGCENEVIVVEVKTTLKVEDVEDFIGKLKDKFLSFFPEYKGRYRVYGAVAGLKLQEGVDKFAIKNGLLVFKYKDKGEVEVLNPEGFKLRDFGQRKA